MKACTGAGIGCAPYSSGLIKPVRRNPASQSREGWEAV
jgi:hypothetical protein